MSDTGWVNPGTMAQKDIGISNSYWSNPDNVKTSDDSYATLVGDSELDIVSYYLVASNFNLSVPDATINGIEFRVECKDDTGSNQWDQGRIIDSSDTVLSQNDRGDEAVNITEKYIYFGSSTDLWGETWSYSDVNNSNFGCAVHERFYKTNETFYVDHIQIKVYYTDSDTPTVGTGYPLPPFKNS